MHAVMGIFSVIGGEINKPPAVDVMQLRSPDLLGISGPLRSQPQYAFGCLWQFRELPDGLKADPVSPGITIMKPLVLLDDPGVGAGRQDWIGKPVRGYLTGTLYPKGCKK